MSTASLTQSKTLGRYNDVLVALAIALILSMMITPLPPLLLDILLVLNTAISLLILLISIYVKEALEFSVFPSLLLVLTLFRLGLNVSATRLILSTANAGKVIASFGSIVVGGSYVVGVVIFVTLLVIQFMVITNGAGRVAEVAARFTLDAMPGKQLSIDADLNSGLIDEDEARKRRALVAKEADFYGAMDGASKFVKGDAIAAVVIVIVNVIGGFVIGIWQLQMDMLEALQTYVLLTVGQGLVTQIPSILVSTATGLLVTRSASEDSLGNEMVRQFRNTKALLVVAGFLVVLALVPGVPKLPFLGLGAAMGSVGWLLRQRELSSEEERRVAELPPSGMSRTLTAPEETAALLQVDPLELEIGYGLIPLVDETLEDNLLTRVGHIRRQLALDLGFILPRVRIRDNLRLPPDGYCIKVRGAGVAQGELRLRYLLAMPTRPDAPPLKGIRTAEPAFGLPAWWIEEKDKADAELAGYTVIDPLSVLVTHLSETIKTHAPHLLGVQDVQNLLDNLQESTPAAVEGVIPDRLSISELQAVLRNLLRERISIRDLTTILETVSRYSADTKDPEVLTEVARRALSYTISDQYATEGVIHVATMDPATEAQLGQSVRAQRQLGLHPETTQQLLTRIGEAMEKLARLGHQPVLLLLSHQEARLPLSRLVERAYPSLAVLSYSEVSPHTDVESHVLVSLEGATE
ncbi:MAG TPA: flagellar biosynthesis protein FlhA [Anaerolineae bacterium]|nr:flagellar biosynthesis protein FlhA [Anaerolineae bacterium]